MAEKKIGKGTQFKKGATTISQVIDLDPPKSTKEEVEATDLASTVRETLPGDPPDPGDLGVMQAWTPGDTNHELIDTAHANSTIEAYSIVWNQFTTPKTDSFSAWVKEIGPEKVTIRGLITRRIVLKLTTIITRS